MKLHKVLSQLLFLFADRINNLLDPIGAQNYCLCYVYFNYLYYWLSVHVLPRKRKNACKDYQRRALRGQPQSKDLVKYYEPLFVQKKIKYQA